MGSLGAPLELVEAMPAVQLCTTASNSAQAGSVGGKNGMYGVRCSMRDKNKRWRGSQKAVNSESRARPLVPAFRRSFQFRAIGEYASGLDW
jgi:hypothetical protein